MHKVADNGKPITRRAYSIDAHGYAILTMVLSATMIYGILPAWMYHAQETSPTHTYHPELSELIWIDLVFPFFLFTMGAVFPFSLRRKYEKGESRWNLAYGAVRRGVQLIFFAIFIQHFYPYMLSAPQNMRVWLLALTCFAVLFPMFMRIPLQMPKWGVHCHQAGRLRCGNSHDALYGLCQWYGVQSLYQQHYHPIAGQHGFFRFVDLSVDNL